MTHVLHKNLREELRIGVEEFRGHRLLNLRVWFQSEDGEMRPGKQGLAVRVAMLPELLLVLEQIAREEEAGTK